MMTVRIIWTVRCTWPLSHSFDCSVLNVVTLFPAEKLGMSGTNIFKIGKEKVGGGGERETSKMCKC